MIPNFNPEIFKRDKPPPGYIAGLGRGAMGFMTRSDIGPASATPELGGAAGRGRGAAAGGAGKEAGSVPGQGEGQQKTFDQFGGYNERLFATAVYEADDAEADRIYGEVDASMDQRNKRRREMKEEEDARKAKLDSSRISDQFTDLKRDLAKMTPDEWDAIPDMGDYSLKFKQKKQENFMPVPDNIIEIGAGAGSGVTSAIDPRAGTASVYSGGMTDIRGLSEARGQMLNLGLKKMSDSVSGQTVVDPQGYLTAMSSANAGIGSDTDVQDIKKARLLLKSVISTNPRHGPGWIAAARLEEQVRDPKEARRIIQEGCEHCPEDEDVWLEAARLQTQANAKIVLADAVRHLPRSVKLWIKASDMESDEEAKKAVLRKALTLIPASETLWKAAISLEAPDDARVMLSRAVECVPRSLDLWLALARLESYDNAQKVLNQARLALPQEPLVWITAARLEETQGRSNMVDKIITRALKSLSSQQVIIDREAWIGHAEDCERAGAPFTCSAIVSAVLDIGVEEIDRRRTWAADAEGLEARGSIITARSVYSRMLTDFPTKEGIWLRAAQFERKHGTRDSLDAILKRAVSHCPTAEVLWLMAAKEKWLAGKVSDSRMILREAFAANPDSEQIWLAAVKLEWENGEFDRARALLEKARSQAPSARVWMKSALLEREMGSTATEESLLLQGLKAYPTAPKLYMMLGQVHERAGALDRAREAYHAGLRAAPSALHLWRLAARLEERVAGAAKARTLLETARQKNPKSPELWIEAIRLERRAGSEKTAESLMAKALQECPTSGKLLAEDIDTAPRPAQKRKSLDALKKADNDPFVVLSVARLFWQDRKYDKARKWYDRAVTLDADLGDGWAWYLAFEVEQGDDVTREEVRKRCAAAEPAHGERWQAVAKRPENRKLSKAQVLEIVTAELQREEQLKKAAQVEGANPHAAALAAGNGAAASSASLGVANGPLPSPPAS